jgi:hypothetical protein
MTPKEKANELVKSFKSFSYYDYHDLTSRFRREESNVESAIECALIAVDEMIEELYEWGEVWMKRRIEYWQEVKQEINKL